MPVAKTIEEYQASRQKHLERMAKAREQDVVRKSVESSQNGLKRSISDDSRKNDIRPIPTKTPPKTRGCGCGKRNISS